MSSFISKAALEARKARYTKGSRVELVSMNDPYTTLKAGDAGTVEFVDDIGTVFVKWDNGSSLGVVYGEDSIRKLDRAQIPSLAETLRENTRKSAEQFRGCEPASTKEKGEPSL